MSTSKLTLASYLNLFTMIRNINGMSFKGWSGLGYLFVHIKGYPRGEVGRLDAVASYDTHLGVIKLLTI